MVRLQIRQCVPDGSDPGRVMDAIICDGLVARMDVALRLTGLGNIQFFTSHNGKETDVVIAKSPAGRFYLKTEPNTTISDNLGEIRSRTLRPPAKPASVPLAPLVRGNGLLGRLKTS